MFFFSSFVLKIVVLLIMIDKDFGDNNKIMYEIFGGNVNEWFFINLQMGVIFIWGLIDCENKIFYDLVVKVIDGGILLMYSFSYVFVKIIDLNDNILVFLGFYLVDVDEDFKVGFVLQCVIVFDKDENLDLMYFFSNGKNS